MYPGLLLLSISIVSVIFCARNCSCVSNIQWITARPVNSVGVNNSSGRPPHPEPEEDEEEEEDQPEKISVHDYLINYLPRCPSSYTLYLEHSDKFGVRRKGPAGLRGGQYKLCSQRGRARLRECSATSRSARCVTRAEYLITVVESSKGPSSQPGSATVVVGNSNSVDGKGEDEGDRLVACQPKNCPSNQLMAINMRNPTDCSSFFICIMGQHFLLSCPPGHQFSEEYGVCLERKFATCQVNPLC